MEKLLFQSNTLCSAPWACLLRHKSRCFPLQFKAALEGLINWCLVKWNLPRTDCAWESV